MMDLAKRVFQLQQRSAEIMEDGESLAPMIFVEMRNGREHVSPVPVDGLQPDLIDKMREQAAGYLVWADVVLRPQGSDGAGGDTIGQVSVLLFIGQQAGEATRGWMFPYYWEFGVLHWDEGGECEPGVVFENGLSGILDGVSPAVVEESHEG